VEEIGSETPLPTVTWEEKEDGEGEESIPGSETMCDVAPESMTQWPLLEEPAAVFRAAMRPLQSQAGGAYS
jgi:hypothetical protein